MTEEENNKIAAARKEIQDLEAKQADIYSRLSEDLNLPEPKENFLFDYIYNSGAEVDFDSYVETIEIYRKAWTS